MNIPPHLSHIPDAFTKEALVELLEALSQKAGYEIDHSKVHEASKEDLLIDLSWLFHQVGEEQSLKIFIEIMMAHNSVIH